MNYDEVLANLFVGSYPETRADVSDLHAAGITGVLSVQSDDDHDYLGLDWSELQTQYAALGIDARRVPIRDFDDYELRDKLPDAVRALDEMLAGGRIAFVHCTAGINRSPSIVICYLHWILEWDLEEAERHVRRCRQCDPVMDIVRLASADWQRD